MILSRGDIPFERRDGDTPWFREDADVSGCPRNCADRVQQSRDHLRE